MNMPDIKKERHGTDLYREDLIKYRAIANHTPVSTYLRDLFHKAMAKYSLTKSQKVELDRQLGEAAKRRAEKVLLRKRNLARVLTVDTRPIPAKVRKSARFIKAAKSTSQNGKRK